LPGEGYRLIGPLARDYSADDLRGVQIVLLCVPDREIATAAATLAQRQPDDARGALVGHCSGATPLNALVSLECSERFSLHPLMSFPDRGDDGRPGVFQGAAAAVCGSSPDALRVACELARALGLSPFEMEDSDRAAYHAAASIASNFLVTLETAAEHLVQTAGADRSALVPLVRQTLENWAETGPGALTGPIVRGDLETVRRQREAIQERAPQLLELFDTMTRATCELVREPVSV
jgi:predicted short-subunit dehydrogenase-like oxidoreductase (DUF2520 family)